MKKHWYRYNLTGEKKVLCHIKTVEFIGGETVSPPKGWHETVESAVWELRREIAEAVEYHSWIIAEQQSQIDSYKEAEEELDKLLNAQESVILD